jgi:hypothetical protein
MALTHPNPSTEASTSRALLTSAYAAILTSSQAFLTSAEAVKLKQQPSSHQQSTTNTSRVILISASRAHQAVLSYAGCFSMRAYSGTWQQDGASGRQLEVGWRVSGGG